MTIEEDRKKKPKVSKTQDIKSDKKPMINPRYKKQAITFIIIMVIITALLFAPFILVMITGVGYISVGDGLLRVFDNSLIEAFIIFLVIWPLSAFLGNVLGGYVFGPLYLFLHKRLFVKAKRYEVRTGTKPQKFKFFSKAFIPSMLAFTLAFYLSYFGPVREFLFKPGAFDGIPEGQHAFLFMFYISTITVFIATVLYSGVIFLLDVGIIYNTEKKSKKKGYAPEVRSVGSSLNMVLKSYSIISFFLVFVQNMSTYFATFTPEDFETGGIFMIIMIIIMLLLVFGLPAFLSLLSIPGFIFLDKNFEKRNKFIAHFAEYLEIVPNPDFDIYDVSNSKK